MDSSDPTLDELEKKFPVLKFFKYRHLPDILQRFSKPFADIAIEMARDLNDSPHPGELAAGLRKLLEAKDCLVRARLPDTGEPIGKKPLVTDIEYVKRVLSSLVATIDYNKPTGQKSGIRVTKGILRKFGVAQTPKLDPVHYNTVASIAESAIKDVWKGKLSKVLDEYE